MFGKLINAIKNIGSVERDGCREQRPESTGCAAVRCKERLDMDDRFCRDCRHYDDVLMLCTRGKQPSGKNPVTGDQEYKYKVLRWASTERESWMPWSCGKRGRHFEKANDGLQRPKTR